MGHRPLLGRPLREAVPEVVWQQHLLASLDQVYRTGQPYRGYEVEAQSDRTNTGVLETTYFNIVQQATHDEQGAVNGVISFAYDVTEQVLARRQVQQLNKELEARVQARTQEALALHADLLAAAQHQAAERLAFYNIFEQTPALVALLRAPGHRFEYVNPAYQALFPGRLLVGREVAEATPELQAQGFLALLDRVYQTGETYSGQELPFTPPPAPGQPPRPRYFNFTYQAYRENGEVAGINLFAFDVTEQVRARQATEATARQLRLLTDALPVLIGYLDRERRYQFANEAYRTWFQQDPAALLGRPVREVVGEAAYAATAGYMDRALAGERLDFEATMPYREGFTRHIRTSYIPDVQQGVVQGFYTLVTDITDQVAAHQQVAQLNQELRASNHDLNASNRQLTRTNVDLDTFVYTASHDLKAPITNIEGILAALRDTLPPAVQQDAVVAHLLGLLDLTVGRFLTTIEQLTDLSRLQHTYNEPAEHLALAPVVAGVVADLAPLIDAAQAQVHLAVPAELHVSFAPASLRSIVYNLLSNAIKYRDPDRPAQVWLRAEAPPGAVVLSVQDNGLGLTDSQRGRLFGVFQRLHTHVAGTGVGLYMIKRLIENAGASITVTSVPDVGSTFAVTFPSIS